MVHLERRHISSITGLLLLLLALSASASRLQKVSDSSTKFPSSDGEIQARFERQADKASNQLFSWSRSLLQNHIRPLIGDDGFTCSLKQEIQQRVYDESKKTWLIDAKTLQELENDIQIIINCTSENDVILFQHSATIKPKQTITIPWKLIISAAPVGDLLLDGEIIETIQKVVFTCPNKGSLIVSRSSSLTIANAIFSGCTGAESIIRLNTGCKGSKETERNLFAHVDFRNNTLFNNQRLLEVDSNSCASLELENVALSNNECSSTECMMLASSTTLRNCKVDKNRGQHSAHERSVFNAPNYSRISANNISAKHNEVRLFNIANSILILSDSEFFGNAKHNESDNERRPVTGGSILLSQDSTISILNSVFEHNLGENGGCLYLRASKFRFENCSFVWNDAGEGSGGSVYIRESQGSVVSCVFDSNAAKYGGALHSSRNSTVELLYTTFRNNTASDTGGGTDAYGTCSLYFKNCSFAENRAEYGAAIAISLNSTGRISDTNLTDNTVERSGGALYAFIGSLISTLGCTFRGNKAEYGGAVSISRFSEAYLWTSAFDENMASKSAGAVDVFKRSSVSLLNSTFTNNTALHGGAVHGSRKSMASIVRSSFVDNLALINGGSINMYDRSYLSVLYCAFTRNTGGYGGAIYVHVNSTTSISNASFADNMANRTGGAIYMFRNSSMSLSRSMLQRNQARFGGAVTLSNNSTAQLSALAFVANVANVSGGAVDVYRSSAVSVSNSSFAENEAQFGGAVLISNSSSGEIANSLFENNLVSEAGGAINVFLNSFFSAFKTSFKGNVAKNGAAVVVSQQSEARFNTSLFAYNKANIVGGGVDILPNSSLYVSQTTFKSNEAEHGGGIFASTISSLKVKKTLFTNSSFVIRGVDVIVPEKISLFIPNFSYKRGLADKSTP